MSVPSWGGIGARTLIVGEAPGADEVEIGAPFVGASGRLLAGMLMEAGIIPRARLPYPSPWRAGVGMGRGAWQASERQRCASIMGDFWREQPVYLTNVCPDRPPGNDLGRFVYTTARAKKEKLEGVKGVYIGPEIASGLGNLQELIESREWDLIIACGAWPLWALTEDSWGLTNVKGRRVPAGIGTWRGSLLTSTHGVKLVPIYHPAAVLRNYAWRAITVHDLRVRAKPAAREPWKEPSYQFTVRPSFEDTMGFLDGLWGRLEGGEEVWSAWDLETRGGHIACCGIGLSDLEAFCIPFMDIHRPAGYWSRDEEVAIVRRLRAILRHPGLRLIGQNFLYDAQYIVHDWFVVSRVTQDTMIDQHVLFAGLPKGLDFLASMYCRYYRYWKAEGKEWNPGKHGEERGWIYNCKDAVNTFEVGEALRGAIRANDLSGPQAFQMTLYPVVLGMMLRGVRVDHRRRITLSLDLFAATEALEARFDAMIEESWVPKGPSTRSKWYRSNKQQMGLFYEVLGIPPVMKRTKEGNRPTVDDAALKEIAEREPVVAHICKALGQYRKVENAANVLASRVDEDLRMRSSYNQTGTETYRFSSSENVFGRGMNLQNVTSGEE